MEWLSENWLWVLIGVAFLAMHMFGHGGHGGRGGHGSQGGDGDDGGSGRSGSETRRRSAETPNENSPPGHRH